MAEVKLYKKMATYVKDGEERTATNFYIKCGDALVPVEVRYFENKETGRDDRYRERKVLMSAFAEDLPDKPGREKKTDKPADSEVPF